MTCIVGIVENGIAYIGGDTQGSNSITKTVRLDKKVFKLKGLESTIIGYTTSYRMGQLLMYEPNLIDSRDIDLVDHEYLVTKTIPKIIRLFEDNGYARNKSGEKIGGTFLLAHKDTIYKIYDDFQVEITSDKYTACGSGEEIALGALYATEGSGFTPEERIRIALNAASKFCVSVGGDYDILETEGKKREIGVVYGTITQ